MMEVILNYRSSSGAHHVRSIDGDRAYQPRCNDLEDWMSYEANKFTHNNVITKLKFKFPWLIHSKSKSRLTLPILHPGLLILIFAIILEFSMVSCMPITTVPVVPAKQLHKPSSFTSTQVPQKYHHHHHRHHHKAKQHHSKHFHVESLEFQDTSASLSIVTPLDVLRQNMLFEMQRKRLRDAKNKQVQFNKEFLEKIG